MHDTIERINSIYKKYSNLIVSAIVIWGWIGQILAGGRNGEMLLTFVVFVQTKEYMSDVGGIEKQCRKFNTAARERLQGDGYVYTYGTVDKNDFVICSRSKKYKNAVSAIMKLHEAGYSVVYSYSVFGISRARQMQLSEEEYSNLNKQKIDSISLKGVANSTKMRHGVSYALDVKYIGFCKELVRELYQGEEGEGEPDYKIYDILGDNDFRLIAREVPLGNLIRQFGENGKLDYKGDAAQYTFYSTHLVLNTRDERRQDQIQPLGSKVICDGNRQLQGECYRSGLCEQMKSEMERINHRLHMWQSSQGKEKLVAAFHGVYQLIQSLTALEAAPTKKYDFLSLYYPMKTLISILKEKTANAGMLEELSENDCLYDFIHKISMTLHGTLRTDIQFFQIRDFNATVHYAPAKLRAFYTFFVFMLSAHFRDVSSENNKHCYIFSPGMFSIICVQQLFWRPDEKERLMLITVPERRLYFVKNMCIILAHEVGHLIGDAIRKRKDRHIAIIECSYRTLCLEITKLIEQEMQKNEIMGYIAKNAYAAELTFNDKEFLQAVKEYDDQEVQGVEKKDYVYYSAEALERIQKVYSAVGARFGYKTWNEYCSRLKAVYQKYINQMEGKEYSTLAKEAHDNHLFYEIMVEELARFFSLFEFWMLPDILGIFHYLMSETVSDLLAILVLGLKPIEYVNSLADEIKPTGDKQDFDNGISKVRIALVFSAAEKLQEDFGRVGQSNFQLDEWSDVYGSLIPQRQEYPEAFWLAMKAFNVHRSLGDKLENIEKYESSYNQKEHVFVEHIYNFLNDIVVYQCMCDYLVACGKEYLEQLRNNAQHMYGRKIISDAFRNCAGSSPIELMSQIDEFLANFESDWKEKCFRD